MNVALVACTGTVTLAGTETATLLLVKFTTRPPEGAPAVRVTLQLSVPVPVIDPLAQLRLGCWPVGDVVVPGTASPPQPARRKHPPSNVASLKRIFSHGMLLWNLSGPRSRCIAISP